MSKRWTEVLCTKCGGNGVVKIPGGVSQCPRCDGRCYEPEPASLQSIQRREGVGVAEAMRIQAAEPLAALSDLALLEACDSRFGSLTLYGRGSVHLILEQLKSYVKEGTAPMASAPEDRSWMMNQAAFEKMIAENLAWLDSLPHSLERSHVREIVRNCVKHYYPAPLPVPPQVQP